MGQGRARSCQHARGPCSSHVSASGSTAIAPSVRAWYSGGHIAEKAPPPIAPIASAPSQAPTRDGSQATSSSSLSISATLTRNRSGLHHRRNTQAASTMVTRLQGTNASQLSSVRPPTRSARAWPVRMASSGNHHWRVGQRCNSTTAAASAYQMVAGPCTRHDSSRDSRDKAKYTSPARAACKRLGCGWASLCFMVFCCCGSRRAPRTRQLRRSPCPHQGLAFGEAGILAQGQYPWRQEGLRPCAVSTTT